MLKLSGYSAHGSWLEKYGGFSSVKANGLMRAQELSGNSARGFREGKAVFRPQAVLAAIHEPPRSHEPRISVSAMPNHWHLTNRFSLSHSLLRFHTLALGIIGWACGRAGALVGPVLHRVDSCTGSIPRPPEQAIITSCR